MLPFSRATFKEFHFALTLKKPEKEDFLITIHKYSFKVDRFQENYNEKLLSFGFSRGKNFFVIEKSNIPSNENNYHNIISQKISEKERFIAGVAKSVNEWDKATQFCSLCGKNLLYHNKESAKFCENCNTLYFPKLNPAVIVAIKKENKILLTRKKEWKANRYGIVAGFIEYGETAEEAVIREVFEETALEITNLQYIASQFWPFPYQLMIGFHADYKKGEIKIDSLELEEAKWFDISNLPILPPEASIARYLVDEAIKSINAKTSLK